MATSSVSPADLPEHHVMAGPTASRRVTDALDLDPTVLDRISAQVLAGEEAAPSALWDQIKAESGEGRQRVTKRASSRRPYVSIASDAASSGAMIRPSAHQ